MTNAPTPNPDDAVEGDDRAVGRGFRASLVVIALLAAVIAGVVFLRPTPTPTPGSAAPVAPPAPSQAERTEAAAGVPFRDVAGEAGVDFTHESGARGGKLLPECLGGGVAIVDLDWD